MSDTHDTLYDTNRAEVLRLLTDELGRHILRKGSLKCVFDAGLTIRHRFPCPPQVRHAFSTEGAGVRGPTGQLLSTEDFFAHYGGSQAVTYMLSFCRKTLRSEILRLYTEIHQMDEVINAACCYRTVPNKALIDLPGVAVIGDGLIYTLEEDGAILNPDGDFSVIQTPEELQQEQQRPNRASDGSGTSDSGTAADGIARPVDANGGNSIATRHTSSTAQQERSDHQAGEVDDEGTRVPSTDVATSSGSNGNDGDEEGREDEDGDKHDIFFRYKTKFPMMYRPSTEEIFCLTRARSVLKELDYLVLELCSREIAIAPSKEALEEAFNDKINHTPEDDALASTMHSQSGAAKDDADTAVDALEMAGVLQRDAMRVVSKITRDLNVVRRAVLYFFVSARCHRIAVAAGTERNADPMRDRREAEWERRAMAVKQLWDSIEQMCKAELYVREAFRVQRKLHMSVEEMNNRARQWAAEREREKNGRTPYETAGCLLMVDGIRHSVTEWLAMPDVRELQLVCLESCKNVRSVTPFSMHVSQMRLRDQCEVRDLVKSRVDELTDECIADHKGYFLDHGGSCRLCGAFASDYAVVMMDTPRWVWFRQSTAYRSRRRSAHPPVIDKRARRDGRPLVENRVPSAASRVPPLLITRMTWSQGNRELNRGLAMPPQLENLTLGYNFSHSLDDITWPSRLRSLTLGDCFVCPLDGDVLPPSLVEITFGYCFNRPVDRVVWPSGLRRIEFGQLFNQPIVGVTWPPTLKTLTFGERFNQEIHKEVVFPSGLKKLFLGLCFKKPLAGCVLPEELEEFTVSTTFDHDIRGVRWPDGLRRLDLGCFFDQTVDGVTWPSALEYLHIGGRFNQRIDNVSWPTGLKEMRFGPGLAQPVDKVEWPPALQVLVLGQLCYNSDSTPVTGPPWIRQFRFFGM